MFMLVCLADTWILTYSKLNSLTHPTPTPTTTPLVLLWHLYFHFHFQFSVVLPIQLPKPETSEALSTLIWPLLPVPMPLRSLGPPWFPRPLSHTCLSLLFIIYFWGYFPKTNQVGHCFRASALQGWCQSPQLPGSGLHSLTLVCVLLRPAALRPLSLHAELSALDCAGSPYSSRAFFSLFGKLFPDPLWSLSWPFQPLP